MQTQAAVGDGTCVVDALLTWRDAAGQSQRLVIELDGPAHFTVCAESGERRPNGATLLRDGQLRRWGLPLLSIPVAVRGAAVHEVAAALRPWLQQRGFPR